MCALEGGIGYTIESMKGWPVILAGTAFLYLWWLAALTFDLAFIWHYYIRHSVAQEYVEERLRATAPAAVEAAGVATPAAKG